MNRVDTSNPPTDDIDVLLGNFFKGEMPASWPAFAYPDKARTLPLSSRKDPPRRFLFGSRLSLVASVALLLFAAWMLGGRMSVISDTPLPHLGDDGSAHRLNGRPPGDQTAPESTPERPALPDLDLGPTPVSAKKLESSLRLEHGKDKAGHTSVGVTVGPVEK